MSLSMVNEDSLGCFLVDSYNYSPDSSLDCSDTNGYHYLSKSGFPGWLSSVYFDVYVLVWSVADFQHCVHGFLHAGC